MTAHQLAQYLLKCPNLPVYINGWGSDEGGEGAEVSGGIIMDADRFGYNSERLNLIHGEAAEWEKVGRPAIAEPSGE